MKESCLYNKVQMPLSKAFEAPWGVAPDHQSGLSSLLPCSLPSSCSKLFDLKKKKVYLFILRERDRETERIPSRPFTVSADPDGGLDPTTHEIVT